MIKTMNKYFNINFSIFFKNMLQTKESSNTSIFCMTS